MSSHISLTHSHHVNVLSSGSSGGGKNLFLIENSSSHNIELQQMRHEGKDIKDYISNLQNRIQFAKNELKRQIEDKLARQQSAINLINMQIEQTVQRQKKQERQIDEDPEIRSQIQLLEEVKRFYEKLNQNYESLQRKINDSKELSRKYEFEIHAKREKIRQINREAMVTIDGIEKLKALRRTAYKALKMQQTKSSMIKSNNQFYQTSVDEGVLNQSNQNFTMITAVDPNQLERGNLQRIREQQKIAQLRNKFTYKCNNFFSLKKLLVDCFEIYKKKVDQVQKISHNSGGFNETIFFDMNYQQQKRVLKSNSHSQSIPVLPIQKQFFANNDHDKKLRPYMGNSLLQDREIKTVVYQTLKTLSLNKIAEMEAEEQMNEPQIRVPYSQFKQYTADQILTILSLKPDIFKQFISSFEIQEKAINLLIIKNQILQKIV